MPEPPVQVVLANDERIIVEGLRAMLAPFDRRVAVVGVATGDPEIVHTPASDPAADVLLTRREAELLTLLGAGLAPRAAAHKMGLSHETVRTHTRNIYRKLGVNDRAGAVAVAWREGLVP